jgi:hypothetical protein
MSYIGALNVFLNPIVCILYNVSLISVIECPNNPIDSFNLDVSFCIVVNIVLFLIALYLFEEYNK